MHSKPQLLSFLTCDNIHLDPTSQKYTLLGLFSGIQAMKFPMKQPRMFVFIAITDVSTGDHTARLSLALPGEAPIFEGDQTFKSQGPLQRLHLVSNLQGLEFQRDGDYGFMLEIDDEPILVTNFSVRQMQLPPGMQLPPQPRQ